MIRYYCRTFSRLVEIKSTAGARCFSERAVHWMGVMNQNGCILDREARQSKRREETGGPRAREMEREGRWEMRMRTVRSVRE